MESDLQTLSQNISLHTQKKEKARARYLAVHQLTLKAVLMNKNHCIQYIAFYCTSKTYAISMHFF